MAKENLENTQLDDTQQLIKQEKKANAAKKIAEVIAIFMNKAVLCGNKNTVWYKKWLFYIAAIVLFVLTYIMSNHGVEIIDWLTALVQGLF